MPTYQVDHPLEQLQLIAHTAANDDALPGLSAKGTSDDRLHIIAAVKADQAEHGPDAVSDESRLPDFDAICYWLRIPWPRHPIRIEPDHEHTRGEDRSVHARRLQRGVRTDRMTARGAKSRSVATTSRHESSSHSGLAGQY